MRLVLLPIVVATSGCSNVFGLDSPVRSQDASLADSSDADTCASFSTQVNTCMVNFGPPLTVNVNITFDTDTKMIQPSGIVFPVTDAVGPGGPLTYLAVADLTIPAGITLRIVGTRAFGVVANGSVQISGTIDISAGGAGARTCNVANGMNQLSGAGGGGGGGFSGDGGHGGPGNSDGTIANGGTGGSAQARPAGPIGGCAGGDGGAGTGVGALGGKAGGGIVVAARTSIVIGSTGAIDAGGQGGRGGPQGTGNDDNGGGGGGSGGMILLEAFTLDIAGIVVANGGGGGEGADSANQGAPGEDGKLANARALGGTGSSIDGGAGASGGALGPSGNAAIELRPGGGGGGGGGAGFIAIAGNVGVAGAIVSPAFTVWP